MPLWTPLCYFVAINYALILQYYSPVWGLTAECYHRLLERQVYSGGQALP